MLDKGNDISQLVRAFGSYMKGQGFEFPCRYQVVVFSIFRFKDINLVISCFFSFNIIKRKFSMI